MTQGLGLRPDDALIVQDTKAGAVLSVYIQPKASTTECVGIHGAAIKIRVAAPPTDGAANEELIRFLARQLSIPVTSVQIKSGAAGRHKRVFVKGATAQWVMARLNLPALSMTVHHEITKPRRKTGE